jgi:hypothetical protein
MACTHTAAMAVLARLDAALGTERRVAAFGSTAARLMRAYATQVEVLRRLRNGGRQFVRVEHVHVNDGGQAVIGNVKKAEAQGQSSHFSRNISFIGENGSQSKSSESLADPLAEPSYRLHSRGLLPRRRSTTGACTPKPNSIRPAAPAFGSEVISSRTRATYRKRVTAPPWSSPPSRATPLRNLYDQALRIANCVRSKAGTSDSREPHCQ